MTSRAIRVFSAALTLGAFPLQAQVLETETSRLLPAHAWKVGSNYEFQWSSEGRESAVPFLIEYGVTRRLELLVEPVAYTAIRPKRGTRATGTGDLEITATYLVHRESSKIPGLAFAVEVKIPTAGNPLIGTQKTDYAGYLIASRKIGRLDLHANLSYTHPGSPGGVALRGVYGGALAVVRQLTARADLFAEILANTSALATENPEGSPTPEVSGNELVGTLGVARRLDHGLQLALSLSYDNTGAVLVRPGFVVRF